RADTSGVGPTEGEGSVAGSGDGASQAAARSSMAQRTAPGDRADGRGRTSTHICPLLRAVPPGTSRAGGRMKSLSFVGFALLVAGGCPSHVEKGTTRSDPQGAACLADGTWTLHYETADTACPPVPDDTVSASNGDLVDGPCDS